MYIKKYIGNIACSAFSATWNTQVIQILLGEKKINCKDFSSSSFFCVIIKLDEVALLL